MHEFSSNNPVENPLVTQPATIIHLAPAEHIEIHKSIIPGAGSLEIPRPPIQRLTIIIIMPITITKTAIITQRIDPKNNPIHPLAKLAVQVATKFGDRAGIPARSH